MDYLDTYARSLALGQLLQSTHKKLAVAESCTGGWLSKELTAVSGASQFFLEGFITYSNEAKTSQLGIESTLIEAHGAVSEAVAAAMVRGVMQRSLADYALATTGIAGPGGGTTEKPVGLVWFGLANRDGLIITQQKNFAGGRKVVREQATGFALQLLIDHIQDR